MIFIHHWRMVHLGALGLF